MRAASLPALARRQRTPAEPAAPCMPACAQVEMPGVDAETTFVSKPIKPLILATGRAVCLFKVGAHVGVGRPWGLRGRTASCLCVRKQPAMLRATNGKAVSDRHCMPACSAPPAGERPHLRQRRQLHCVSFYSSMLHILRKVQIC